VGDARFFKLLPAGGEAVPAVETYGPGLGMKLEVRKAVFAALVQHELQELCAHSLAAPSAAHCQTLQEGAVALVADAAAGHGLAVYFPENVYGRKIVPVHFIGMRDALFFHENDGPDHEHPEQAV
jgi:hypothetical protein